MDKNLKIGLVLLIIASVLFLCCAVAFFILKEAEKEKRLYVEKELSNVIEEKATLTGNLDEMKVLNRNLESKINSAKEEAKRISEELVREKETKKMLALQLEDEKKKSDSLMDDVMAEKEQRLELVQKLTHTEKGLSELQEQYELVLEAKETLEDKLKEMMSKKGVELDRIEVKTAGYQKTRDEPEEMIQPKIKNDAKVLVVNRKFDFVVANVGKEDGIDIGTELDVLRAGEVVAKTKIEKLYDNMSAATILPEWRNARIKEGDQIRISR